MTPTSDAEDLVTRCLIAFNASCIDITDADIKPFAAELRAMLSRARAEAFERAARICGFPTAKGNGTIHLTMDEFDAELEARANLIRTCARDKGGEG